MAHGGAGKTAGGSRRRKKSHLSVLTAQPPTPCSIRSNMSSAWPSFFGADVSISSPELQTSPQSGFDWAPFPIIGRCSFGFVSSIWILLVGGHWI